MLTGEAERLPGWCPVPGTVVRVVQTPHDGSGVRVGVGFGRAEALQGSGAAVWSRRVVPGTYSDESTDEFYRSR